MKMTLDQTKLVGLTMELDLKAKEYKQLCDKLENLKKLKIDANDDLYLSLAKEFSKNQKEIKRILQELQKLQ